MGFFDKFRSKTEELTEQAKSAMGGHKDKAADAMSDASQKAAEHMPGPAADAMGDATSKAQDAGTQSMDQAESDMMEEGGHEWPKS